MSQSVNLVLKSTQISSSNDINNYYNKTVNSSSGSISNNRTSFTWNNINMKVLLGDMYEEYERFNICLNFVAGAATGGGAESNVLSDNRNLQIKLSGLPFTSSYSQPNATNVGSVVMTVVQIPLNAVTTWSNNYFTSQYYTFIKQNMVSLSIDLHTVVGDISPQPDAANKMIGHCIFSFNIYGVDEYRKKDITSQRMDLKQFGYNNI